MFNIMIVIDTDYLRRHYSNLSIDPKKPTSIDHNSQFMICGGSQGVISGQGTANLEFEAYIGDNISFRGTSISGNSDDAIIIYGIEHLQGDAVLDSFTTELVERAHAVVPNMDTQNGLPPSNNKRDFISYNSKVRRAGQEDFYAQFGLYELAKDRQTQHLKGYYYWDLGITVQLLNSSI